MSSQKHSLTSLKAGLQKVYNGSKQAHMQRAKESEDKVKNIAIKLAGPVVKNF